MFVPGKYLEMQVQWVQAGWRDMYSVLHFERDPAFISFEDAADNAHTAWTNAWPIMGAGLSSSVGVRQLRFIDRNTEDGPMRTTAVNLNGVGAGDRLPPGTCLLVRFHALLSSRAHQGRIYIPGWREVDNNPDGTPTTAAVALGNNWANDFVGWNAGGFSDLSIVSKRLNGAIREQAAVAEVQTWSTSSQWARQKRRAKR